MRLMYGVCIVVAELVDDLGYTIVVAFGEGIADGRFESVIVWVSSRYAPFA